MQTFASYLDGWYDVEIQLQMHLYKRYEQALAAGNGRKDQIETAQQFEQWREHVRKAFLDGIGGLPQANCPLEVDYRGELRVEGFTIRRLLYQSLPGWYVTANLYVPDEPATPAAAVLFLCGHIPEAKAYGPYQNVCQHLARNGFIVLAIDPLGQGERLQYFDPETGQEVISGCTQEHCYEGVQCWWLGQSLTRYFLHDAMRGIDLLQSLPEVDPERIGVTGCSGGGTQTTMMMLGDPRIAAAVPATFIMHRRDYLWTGQAQDAEQIYPGTSAAGIDHDDYLTVMAPKPVMVGAVAYDLFPLEGAKYSLERARRIYELFDAGDKLKLEVDLSQHEYTDNLARAATRWFCRHLQDKSPEELTWQKSKLFTPEELWATETGQLLGDDPAATTIWQLNRGQRQQQLSELPGGQQRLRQLRDWLSEQVSNGRRPVEFHPRACGATYEADLYCHKYWWWSEQDIINAGLHLRLHPANDNPDSQPLTIALFAGGTPDVSRRESWIRQRCQDGQQLLVLDVRGWGALLSRKLGPADRDWYYGTHYKLLSEAVFLGDSLCAMRVFDVLRAIEFVQQELTPTQVSLYADTGATAIYATLAALLDESVGLELPGGIPDVDSFVEDHFYRYQDGVHGVLPGLLARCTTRDLAEALTGQLT